MQVPPPAGFARRPSRDAAASEESAGAEMTHRAGSILAVLILEVQTTKGSQHHAEACVPEICTRRGRCLWKHTGGHRNMQTALR